MEDDELFLQIGDAVVSNPLLHLQIVKFIGELLVPSLLTAESITKAFTHLLTDQRCVDKLLRLYHFLVEFELQTHVYLYLSL